MAASDARSVKRLHETALRLYAERGVNPLSVSELAEAAGVARGTIYNNLSSPDTLFEQVATRLSREMHDRITRTSGSVKDPARRLANGIRFYIRRAHEEPLWGRFIVRFAHSNETLQELLSGPPAAGLRDGIHAQRFQIREDQIVTVLGLIAGACLSGMIAVLEGRQTWREAGSETAAFVLRGMGIKPKEAIAITTADLPPLSPGA